MKKIFVLLVIISAGFVSSCKKEAIEPSAPFKAKSIGDIKEHSGWDGRDTTTAPNNGGN